MSAGLICKAHVRKRGIAMAAAKLGKGRVTRVSDRLLDECEAAVVTVLADALEEHCRSTATLGPVAPAARRRS